MFLAKKDKAMLGFIDIIGKNVSGSEDLEILVDLREMISILVNRCSKNIYLSIL